MSSLGDLVNYAKTITDPKMRNSSKKLLNKITKVQSSVDKFDEKIKNLGEKESSNVSHSWITFESMEERNQAYEHFFRTPCERCLAKCCCCISDEAALDKKVLKCKVAPDPTNINWQNFDLSRTEIIIRRGISILITIALLIVSTE